MLNINILNEKLFLDMELDDIPDYLEKDRSRRERRKRDFKKAKRKEKITREVYHSKPLDEEGWHWYNNLHQFSKNKIHCSCPMCSALEKTNTKKLKGKGYGCRGQREDDMWERPPIENYDENGNLVCCVPGKPKRKSHFGYWLTNERKGKNWSMKDTKRIQDMEEQIEEYEGD